MNRFLIDYNVDKIAKSLCDQHIVKMPLEEAQMLCTALWHHAPEYAEEHNLYKPVHHDALWLGRFKIPRGVFTRHPQCFSGHDELKTAEYFPVEAYRKFYIVDKSRFARYNKGRTKPDWMKEVA